MLTNASAAATVVNKIKGPLFLLAPNENHRWKKMKHFSYTENDGYSRMVLSARACQNNIAVWFIQWLAISVGRI
jgi:hypothetical protein